MTARAAFADKFADASLVVGAGVLVYAVAAILTGGIDRNLVKMLRRKSANPISRDDT